MSENDPIRVMVVDDHAMVRAGLEAFFLISDDMELVAEASNGQEALEACERVQPDVVLMDLMMPRMDGVTATRIIRERWPQTQVIALTGFHERGLVQKMLQAGAISYVLKDVSAEDLLMAIRGAYAGRPTLAPEAIQALLTPEQTPGATPGHDLTRREREVLTLMVEGLNNRQIAKRLIVSRATAAGHVSNILAKLGVANRTEAVALAVRHHITNNGG